MTDTSLTDIPLTTLDGRPTTLAELATAPPWWSTSPRNAG